MSMLVLILPLVLHPRLHRESSCREEECEIDLTVTRVKNRCECIDPTDECVEEFYLARRDKVTLIQHDEVSELELIECDICMIREEGFVVQCIDETDDRVELHATSHIIHEK